jgi:murein DD-endopeptidase MepM/ murein hydrolase activator NlpD
MRRAVTVLVCLLVAAPASAESQLVVESGQTLYAISKRTGCSVKAIKRANDLSGDMIFVGQTLTLPDCAKEKKARAKEEKERKKKKIAKRERIDRSMYDLKPAGGRVKAKKGQSIGAPWSGELKNATKLPKGRGYFIRRPHRAFGTAHMVTHIQRAIKAVRKRFPRVHQLAIGDLSSEDGGDLSMHHSHQSGRDVDIGFYFKKKPEGYPKDFVGWRSADLDNAATWALLHAFARTADAANGVKVIYLDYDLQAHLYEWAKERGVPEKHLDKLFQYPDGDGIVRHEDGHHDHFHIRFKCPENDDSCSG